MKPIICIGELSLVHIILVILPILTISGPLWIRRVKNHSKYNSVYIILNYIGTFLLAAIIDVILSKVNRSKKSEINVNTFTNSVSTVNKKKTINVKMHFMILILAFIDFIRITGLIFLGADDSFLIASIELRGIELVFMSFLSKWLLGTRLFTHHIVSIICILLGIGLASVYAIQSINIHFSYQVPLAIFFYFCLSLRCICDKWVMEIHFLSPQRLLMYEGLYSSVFSFIILGCQHFIQCPSNLSQCGPDNNLRNVFKDFSNVFTDKDLVAPVTAYVLVHSINNLLMMLINKYLTPCHRAVSDSIAYFIWLTIMFFDYPKHNQAHIIAFFVIGYLIILLSSLVYNEVLILYFCNLEVNVKREIIQRGDRSILTIENIDKVSSLAIDETYEDDSIFHVI